MCPPASDALGPVNPACVRFASARYFLSTGRIGSTVTLVSYHDTVCLLVPATGPVVIQNCPGAPMSPMPRVRSALRVLGGHTLRGGTHANLPVEVCESIQRYIGKERKR